MKIFVESGSDLTLAEMQAMNVTFLPMYVTIDDITYQDQLEITNENVYDAIQQGLRPLTSQVSIEQMTEEFTRLAVQDEQGIYYTFSSALSGTYQSAVMIRDQVKESYPQLELEIIDSLSASRGLALQIKRMVTLRDQGAAMDQLKAEIKQMSHSIVHLFTVADLNYLAQGGRLSRGSAFLGSLINIRPLLHVEQGQLVPIGKFRGQKKVFNEMIQQMKQDQADAGIEIAHANNQEDAAMLARLIKEQFPDAEIIISEIGPTIASHTGQGTIALFYFKR